MPLPQPELGLVLHYSYLWAHEHRRGLEEGVKDRPCVIMAIETAQDGSQLVTVVPITHTPPSGSVSAIELPQAVKRYLGLDGERSWIVIDDFNRFRWPGYDIRAIPARADSAHVYGYLPPVLFDQIVTRMTQLFATQPFRPTPR